MQETCLNILNAEIFVMYVPAQNCVWILDALGQSQIFFFFFLVSLDSVYNTIVPFPVPGNADF